MTRTSNTDPIRIQLTRTTFTREGWYGGCWPNRGSYATVRNRADRSRVRRALRTTTDYDRLILPTKHRHATKWDIW